MAYIFIASFDIAITTDDSMANVFIASFDIAITIDDNMAYVLIASFDIAITINDIMAYGFIIWNQCLTTDSCIITTYTPHYNTVWFRMKPNNSNCLLNPLSLTIHWSIILHPWKHT